MLMGTLTIAFPVSVFSDLWSSELQQVKGFEELNQDEPTTPTGNNGNLYTNGLSTPSPPPGGQGVALEKEDLKEVVACMYKIKESQKQIHSILRKYKIHYDEKDLDPLNM